MAQHKQEIERKWLVRDLPNLRAVKHEQITQGYLTISSDGTEVRVRRKGHNYFETVKSQGALTRDEIEVKLSQKQFRTLWPATEGRRIKKTRYVLKWNSQRLELDVYRGALAKLVIVEVEFASAEESRRFCPPVWFGDEVTEDQRYKNSSLTKGI